MRKNLIFFLLFFVFGEAKSQILLTESFEGATFPPTGWTLINAGTGNQWAQNTNPAYSKSGNNSMYYAYSSTQPANAWAMTPAIAMTSGSTYRISYWYRVDLAAYPENMKVTIGNSATVAAQTTTLHTYNSLTNESYLEGVDTYVASSTGNFNIGFNCFSSADQDVLLIDSIVVQKVNTCSGTPTAGTATASSPYLCGAGNTTLDLTGATAALGLSFQWQSSPAGAGTFNNVGAASGTATYSASVTASTDYRCIVTCTGNPPVTSSIVTVTLGSVPTNDAACSAATLVLNGASVCGNTTCATATNDPTATSNGSTPNNTVWYKYTPTTTGPLNFTLTRPTGVTTGLLYGWLNCFTATGTCPTLTFTELGAGLSNAGEFDLTSNTSVTLTTPSLTAGTTYYFMIDGYSGASGGAYCIQMGTPPAPPANDDCANATTITGWANNMPGTTLSASQSMAPILCAGFTSAGAGDVWYKFTTQNAGSVTITTNGLDVIIQAFSGTCGTLISLSCADVTGTTETLTLTGLAASTTYYFRVYGYGSVFDGQGNFTVSLVGAALPVSIADFKGVRQSNNNALSWTTATEINNAGFELQRSVDGVNFSSLVFVASKAANGNSNGSLSYSFNDKITLAASYYYRLKQIDKDGRPTLSSVVFIKGTKATKFEMVSIYPNPAISDLNVSIASPKSDWVTFVVSDLAGKVIIRQSANVVSGDNNIKLNVSSLAKGTYTVKAVCADGCETAISKFIKQ
jgi:hypothetical protein